jgi:hypothetical protein
MRQNPLKLFVDRILFCFGYRSPLSVGVHASPTYKTATATEFPCKRLYTRVRRVSNKFFLITRQMCISPMQRRIRPDKRRIRGGLGEGRSFGFDPSCRTEIGTTHRHRISVFSIYGRDSGGEEPLAETCPCISISSGSKA